MKKRSAPTLQDPVLNRAVSDIYSILNELIDLIGDSRSQKSNQGTPGKMNVRKEADGYSLEVKHKDGWMALNLNRRTTRKGN